MYTLSAACEIPNPPNILQSTNNTYDSSANLPAGALPQPLQHGEGVPEEFDVLAGWGTVIITTSNFASGRTECARCGHLTRRLVQVLYSLSVVLTCHVTSVHILI